MSLHPRCSRVRRSRLAALCLLCGLCAGAPVLALLQVEPHRIDRALGIYQAEELAVVAGRITATPPGRYSDERFLDFRVEQMVLGSLGPPGTTLRLESTTLIWPHHLVSHTSGTRCLLILRVGFLHPGNLQILTVIPVAPNSEHRLVKTPRDALTLLERELIAGLSTELPIASLRARLELLGPILRPESAAILDPYLTHPDPGTRRRARAAVLGALGRDREALAIAADLQGLFAEREATVSGGGRGPDVEAVRRRADRFWEHEGDPTDVLEEVRDAYFFLEPRDWTWGSLRGDSDRTWSLWCRIRRVGNLSDELVQWVDPAWSRSEAPAEKRDEHWTCPSA